MPIQKAYCKVKLTVTLKVHKISTLTTRNKYGLYKRLSTLNTRPFLTSSKTINFKPLRGRSKCNWKNLNNQLLSNLWKLIKYWKRLSCSPWKILLKSKDSFSNHLVKEIHKNLTLCWILTSFLSSWTKVIFIFYEREEIPYLPKLHIKKVLTGRDSV